MHPLTRAAALAAGILLGLATARVLDPIELVRRTRETLQVHDLSRLSEANLPSVSVVLDRSGRSIGEFYQERRRIVPLDEVPAHVVDAVLAAEDARFFEHSGIDAAAIARATWANVRAGRVVQGASTITQQVAKNLLLSPERTLERKLREAILARELEERSDKDEILSLYLNAIYFGSGAFGIGEAARTYFDKEVGELTVSEAALLAGLPPRPSSYSPWADPDAAESRRLLVLHRMLEEGFLDAAAYEAARLDPPRLHRPKSPASFGLSRRFVEEVRRDLSHLLAPAVLRRGGLVIETTLDLDLQRAAVEGVQRGLAELDERRVDATAPAEAALIALDVETGGVLALVGGRDPSFPGFDRALRARRQPGSAFKPIVYAAAIEAGFTGASVIVDRPAIFVSGDGVWQPRNYGRRFLGALTLREALARSVNNASVHLMRRVGSRHVIDLARRLGITSHLTPSPSLALGSSEVTLLELTRAYGVFAAGGRSLPPYRVQRVRDVSGRVLFEAPSALAAEDEEASRVVDPRVAHVVVDLLRGAVSDPRATGRSAGYLGPVAGKTGTTNGNTDAWFVGFSPEVVTGVWVGCDAPEPLGRTETGARAALPIWSRFMETAMEERPAGEFHAPEGVLTRWIDARTGLLADRQSKVAFLQAFVEGTQPRQLVTRRREVETAQRMLRLDLF